MNFYLFGLSIIFNQFRIDIQEFKLIQVESKRKPDDRSNNKSTI